jgi:hypothetical protein
MSYEGADMADNDTREPDPRWRSTDRVDPVAVIAGLLFIAIAVLALADRLWADIDPVLIVGGAIIAIGLAMIGGVIRRSRRQD